MPNHNLEQFYRTILTDSTLQNQLKEVSDQASFTNLLVDFGTTRGFDFTAEDVNEAIALGQETQLHELRDEDLAIVSGGVRPTKDWTAIIGPIDFCGQTDR